MNSSAHLANKGPVIIQDQWMNHPFTKQIDTNRVMPNTVTVENIRILGFPLLKVNGLFTHRYRVSGMPPQIQITPLQ